MVESAQVVLIVNSQKYMKKKIPIFCLLAVLFLLITLFLFIDAGGFSSDITIRDYVVGSKYKIVKVNGLKPNRIKHGFVTSRVPLVYVDEGKHILLLESRDDNSLIFSLDIEIKAGVQYRIAEFNGKPKLAIVNH